MECHHLLAFSLSRTLYGGVGEKRPRGALLMKLWWCNLPIWMQEAGASVFSPSVRFITKGEEDVYSQCLTQLCWNTAAPLAGTQFQHGFFSSWTQFLSASGLHPSTSVTQPSAYCFDIFAFGTSHWLNAHNDCLKQEFGWWLVSISHVYGFLTWPKTDSL